MWPPIYEFFYKIFYEIARACGFDEDRSNFVAKVTCIIIPFVIWVHVMFFILPDIV